MNDNLLVVGRYNPLFDEILDINMPYSDDTIYRSRGLPAHMLKSRHERCLRYIDYIPEIISHPDYIGVNPNETECSIELVKKYRENILIGIKLDKNEKYLYVSSMYDVPESKVQRRLHSGRLKSFSVDDDSE